MPGRNPAAAGCAGRPRSGLLCAGGGARVGGIGAGLGDLRRGGVEDTDTAGLRQMPVPHPGRKLWRAARARGTPPPGQRWWATPAIYQRSGRGPHRGNPLAYRWSTTLAGVNAVAARTIYACRGRANASPVTNRSGGRVSRTSLTCSLKVIGTVHTGRTRDRIDADPSRAEPARARHYRPVRALRRGPVWARRICLRVAADLATSSRRGG
jgi:hypothetical protein